MVQVLKEHGPVMQRARFEELCAGLGMNRSTFWVYLDYSPVIERFAPGVYGLRGAEVDPGTLESLIPRRQAPASVRLDHGWTEDRRVWVSYRLSDALLLTGVFSIPGGMKSLLAGTYALKTTDGEHIGTVVVKDGTGWGIGPFFRRRGGELGDTLVIIFDLAGRDAQVSIGDVSLLDQYLVNAAQTNGASDEPVLPGEDGPLSM
jgi:hypothetical protein